MTTILGCDEIVPFNSYPDIVAGDNGADIVVRDETPLDLVLVQQTAEIITSEPKTAFDVDSSHVIEMEELPKDALVVSAGPPGRDGADGEQGPPGTSNAGYRHNQVSPASSWLIEHNLDATPAVVLVLDSSPQELVFADVTYPDANHAVVVFPSPETGYASCR